MSAESAARRVAVVTGAGSGIGESCAKKLSSAGGAVALLGRRLDRLTAVAREIESAGGKALAVACDVGDETSVTAARETVTGALGPCDILVNNAGVTKDGLVIRMKTSDFESVVRTNLLGAFLTIRAFAPAMLKNRWGRIVNVGSIVGLTGNAGQANYAASKGGLFALTKSCAKEFARRNVTVNAVAPGFTETEMTRDLDPKLRDDILGKVPLGRFGAPADIASLVAWLCSDAAGYVTGEIIRIDGGMAM